ncbi:MAG: hypothetical protein K6T75_00020 [Acetobacteraceae bacterium]|nr:hypothetical protein [Acetobacteraceae bacterium]
MARGADLISSLLGRPGRPGRPALAGSPAWTAAAAPGGWGGACSSSLGPEVPPDRREGGAGAAAQPGAGGGAPFPPPAAAAGEGGYERDWRQAVRREWGLGSGLEGPGPAGAGPGREAPDSGPLARVVTVFSPKGGAGKTFVASNLGVLLAGRRPGEVALADLALPVGDVGVYLDLAGGPTLIDALPFAADLGGEGIRRFMVQHRPSGLEVLLGPPRPELAELVRPDAVRGMLGALEAAYDLVLLDTPPDLGSEVVGQCLDRSGCVVLVAGADPGCLRQVRLLLELLGRVRGAAQRRLLLVLNRWPGPARLSLAQVGGFLGRPVDLAIPDDRRAVECAALSGRPVAQVHPCHPVTRALDALAQMVWPRPRPLEGLAPARGTGAGVPASRGGSLRRWWGRWRS